MIGFVIGGFNGRRGKIYRLAVSLEGRRLGSGEMLMKEVERRLQNMGCRKEYLIMIPGDKAELF